MVDRFHSRKEVSFLNLSFFAIGYGYSLFLKFQKQSILCLLFYDDSNWSFYIGFTMHPFWFIVSTGNSWKIHWNKLKSYLLKLRSFCTIGSLVHIYESMCTYYHVRLFCFACCTFSSSSMDSTINHISSTCSNGHWLYREYCCLQI